MNTAISKTPRRRAAIPGSYGERILEARRLMKQQRWEEAAAIQQQIIDRILRLPERRRRPGSDRATYLVAAAMDLQEVRVRQNDYEAARQLCRQLQEWDPEETDYWQREVYSLRIREGEVEEGLQGLLALAENNPDNTGHWIGLGREAVECGRLDLAEMALQHAEPLAAESGQREAMVLVWLGRFDLHRKRQQWSEAAQAWEALVAVDERMRQGQEIVVRMFLEAGKLNQAQHYIGDEELGKLLADYYRGQIAYRRGDRVRARHIWRQVVEGAPGQQPEEVTARAYALCWLGRPIKALTELLHAVQISGEYSLRYSIGLALAWAMQGNREGALNHLELARQRLVIESHETLLSRLDWFEFEELVTDAALKAELRPFFALD